MSIDFLSKNYLKNSSQSTQRVPLQPSQICLLYFSGAWSPPCQEFTPILRAFYEQVNREEPLLEIIYVSNDRFDYEFDDYFGLMPWLAIPFESKALIQEIKTRYEVAWFPHVLLVQAEDGRVLRHQVRDEIAACASA